MVGVWLGFDVNRRVDFSIHPRLGINAVDYRGWSVSGDVIGGVVVHRIIAMSTVATTLRAWLAFRFTRRIERAEGERDANFGVQYYLVSDVT